MKTSRILFLVGLAVIVGFLAARWSVAQSTAESAAKAPTVDYSVAFTELHSFVGYLQETGQTNTLNRFNDYSNVSVASQHSAHLGVRVRMLYALRYGRTNDVIRMLEQQMTSDVVGFVAGYRDLPVALREKISLTALKNARDYCKKYPVKSGHADVDEIVTDSFKLLDEKSTR